MEGSRTRRERELWACLVVGILASFVALRVPVQAAPLFTDPPPAEIVLQAGDSGAVVDLAAGQVLAISLYSNPSTGYRWQPVDLDEGILRQRHDSGFQRESPLFGSPGMQTLKFSAVAPESTTLSLTYERPWERGMTAAQGAPFFSIEVRGIGPFTDEDASDSGVLSEAAPSEPVPSVAADTLDLGLPSQFNWCDHGGCTPVRDQGNCGSCWAFATVGALETNVKIHDAVIRDLSEQYLLSCNSDGWSCSGGWWAHDYHQWKIPYREPDAGAVNESSFPYVASQVACNPPHTHHEKILSWNYVGPDDGIPSTSAIKQAIYDHGPISVGVCSNSFWRYSGGVFTINDTSCGPVDHAVVLVGWDDSLGAWHLRNSWGSDWGEDGYMRIQYGVSNVGYSATYVVYGDSSPNVYAHVYVDTYTYVNADTDPDSHGDVPAWHHTTAGFSSSPGQKSGHHPHIHRRAPVTRGNPRQWRLRERADGLDRIQQ